MLRPDSFGPDHHFIVCIIKESAILCPIQHLAQLLPVVDEVWEGPGVDLHVLAGQLPHRNPEKFLHPGQRLHTGHQRKSIPLLLLSLGNLVWNSKAIRGCWERLFVCLCCDAYISVADHVLVVEDHVAGVAEATQAGSHGALGISDAWNQSRYVQLWLEPCQDLSLPR